MTTKRIASLLALLLLVTALLPAQAQEETNLTFAARNAALNRRTGTIACRMDNADYYTVIDAKGSVLASDEEQYTYMSITDHGYIKAEKEAEDGLHGKGLLDGFGRVLIPCEYAVIDIISDRWQTGMRLTPCEAEDKDYTVTVFGSSEKSFYRIDTTDFYFDGQKVGTLSRSDYAGGGCTAYGAYLRVSNVARDYVYYNSKMEPSPYTEKAYGEYNDVYRDGGYAYYHMGSGQQAFVESCTLDPQDLDNPYLYSKGAMYDIRGNLLFNTAQVYDSVRAFRGGYAVAYKDRQYGLIDETGREVIPLAYDSVGYSEDKPLQYGYISAVKGGKFGFLDAQGNETCSFAYAENIVRNYTTFATVKDLDGSFIVLSAAVGELPQHYADVSFPGYGGCLAFVAKDDQKQSAVIDLYGKVLLPFNTYNDVTVTEDGAVALVYHGSRQYEVYQFEIVPSQPEPKAETPVLRCASCGHEFGETAPKFCPECGAKVEGD